MKEIPSFYNDAIIATRERFIQKMKDGNPVHNLYSEHVQQVEKWAMQI